MENFAQLEEHKNLASELDIAANCNWVHRVDWEEMPDYYNAANVIVSISSNDSLPNCIMEAMACGVPVIAGDIPQLAELVTEGVTGYLVPTRNHLILAQRILTVLQNREQIADMLAFNALELIGHTVDSRNTIPMIKQLVMDTAKEA